MAFGNVLLAALGIGLLIFVHELGHFLAARLAGVRVEVFSLGFGRRLCGFEWRGTDFRLSLVPFGGYVMVAGQDPSDDRYPRRESLYAKSVGQRALFWSGGVLMNALLALVVFPLVFFTGVEFPAPIVGNVQTGSPAWEAGIAPGDRVLAVGDKTIPSFDTLHIEVALSGGRPTELTLQGPDETLRKVTVQPRWNARDGLWELGVGIAADPTKPAVVHLLGKSPLAEAGVASGDELLAVDGKPVTPEEALAELQQTERQVQLRLRRQGSTLEVPFRPAAQQVPRIGVAQAATFVGGLRQGVPAIDRLGLRRDDQVLAVDGRPFVGDGLPSGDPASLSLLVLRGAQPLQLTTPLEPGERSALAAAIVFRSGPRLLLKPTEGSPAAAAGLAPGDLLLAIDDQPVADFEDLRTRIAEAGPRPQRFTIARLGDAATLGPAAVDPVQGDLPRPTKLELTITPRLESIADPNVLVVGTERSELVQAETFGAAVALGTARSLDLVKQIYLTLKRMVTGQVAAKNLGGIIRISQVSYQAAKKGFVWFLYLMAMLSVNLAVVNLLPVPVLDGGHLLFLLIEKVKGSPVSARVHGYSQVLGLVFVLMLVLFVTYNDILQLF
ncbi:MAG: RIP metalloprotease RseP [Planctomycetes bacterium]|nr:RIP metalloprotease RseP [Planctomycetota bacterium]